MTWEYPLEKAVADIGPGIPAPELGPTSFDYSHLLEPEHTQAMPGARVIVYHYPDTNSVHASVRDHSGDDFGYVKGQMLPDDPMGRRALLISEADTHGFLPSHVNGKKLHWGRKLYEAIMAHAKQKLGATHLVGGTHSSFASKAHSALAEKHGLSYDPTPNVAGYGEDFVPSLAHYHNIAAHGEYPESQYDSAPDEAYDDKFGPYQYTIKSEEPIDLTKVPVGKLKRVSDTEGVPYAQFFDYSHLLSPEQRAAGYGMELKTIHRRTLDSDPHTFRLFITHPDAPGLQSRDMLPFVGEVNGKFGDEVLTNKPITFEYARINRDHRGKKLGRAAYEAVIAHFKNNYGAGMVKGSTHSSSANATHKAIANKYGLSIFDPPVQKLPVEWDDVADQPEIEPGKHYGSFDSAFGPYAYSLNKSVWEGSDLMKVEEDLNDPYIVQLKNPNQYIDSYELRQKVRSGDWNENRMAALMKYRPSFIQANPSTYFASPFFTRDVWNYVFKDPEGNLNVDDRTARLHSTLLSRLSYDDNAPAWTTENNGLDMYREAMGQVKWDAEHPDQVPEEQHDKNADTLMRLAMGGPKQDEYETAGTEPPLLSLPEVRDTVPLNHKLGNNHTRANLISKLAPMASQSPALKLKLLEYAKNMFSNLERFSSTRTAQYRSLNQEFQLALPALKTMVTGGVPEAFIKKNTTKKGLFTALLSHAPEFPKRKFAKLLEAIQQPGAKRHKIPEVQQHMSSLMLGSPLVEGDTWAAMIKAFSNTVDLRNAVSDPRWSEDLSKHLWDTTHDADLINVLAQHNKLTPATIAHLTDGMTKRNDTLQGTIDARVAELQQKATHPDPNDYYNAVNLNPLTGMYEDRYGHSDAIYRTAPIEYNTEGAHALVSGLKATGAAPELVSSTVGNLLDQWQKAAFYAHHAGVHPIRMESQYGMAAHPWSLSHLLDHKLPQDVHARLADLMAKHSWLPHQDFATQSEWLTHADIGDANILHMLQNSTSVPVIETLMQRRDAKPHWVDAIQQRPEYQTMPDAATDPRFAAADSSYYSRDRLARHRASEFHDALHTAVINSTGVTDEQISRMLPFARPEQVTEAAQHANFGPLSMAALVSAQPTIYSTDVERDANGNTKRDSHGERVYQVATPGTVKWTQYDRAHALGAALKNHPEVGTPEMWEQIRATALSPTVSHEGGYSNNNPLIDMLAQQPGTPADILQYIWDHPQVSNDTKQTLLRNPSAPPEWLNQAIDRPFDEAMAMNLLDNPALTPEQAARLEGNAIAAIGTPLEDDGSPRDRYHGVRPFWRSFATSKYGEGEWAERMVAKMQEHDARLTAAGSSPFWQNTTFGRNLSTNMERNNPDSVFQATVPPVDVRAGSHKLRGIRDMIEASGQHAPIASLPPGPNYNQMQTTATMSDEQWAKIPEKQKAKMGGVRPAKKTGLVSPETVQAFIEGMTSHKYNVSHTTWKHGLQMHNPNVADQVFQLNLTTEKVKQLKEAGVWDTFKEVQDMLSAGQGGIHPLRSVGLGWIRHGGITPQKTVHISEIQSDIRPPGGDWKYAWERYSKAPRKPQIIGKMTGHWDQSNFPGDKLNKMHEIIFGKGVDPHLTILEAFHQHLRDTGQHDVTVHLGGSKFRATLSGMSESDMPIHYKETYDEMPKEMGYAFEGGKYGDEPTQTAQHTFPGMPTHLSPIRKFEDILADFEKAVRDLPDMPVIREVLGERHHNADHYLTPEHKAAGYSMRVRSGVSPDYGSWSVADVYHSGKPVGGVTASVNDPRLVNDVLTVPMSFDLADIAPEHTGKGLGTAMYEALLAHGHSQFGATHVRGLFHSSMASRVHQKLAEKHGLKYEATPNIGGKYPNKEAWTSAANHPYDSKYGPYSYTIDPTDYDAPHGEESLGKMALGNIPMGRATPKQYPNQTDTTYDYSHLLPETYRNAGYKLRLSHWQNRHMEENPEDAHGAKHQLFAHIFRPVRLDDMTIGHIRNEANRIYQRSPSERDAYIRRNSYRDEKLGEAQGYVHADGTLEPHFNSGIHAEHRGQGLGKALYNAMFGHAYNALGARKVSGGFHTQAAGRVHEALAREHGMAYSADTIPAPRKYQQVQALEGAPTVRTSYQYDMKSEMPTELSKSLLTKKIPTAEKVSDDINSYDYSHLLPEEARANHTMLVVHHHGGRDRGTIDVQVLNGEGDRVGELNGFHHATKNEVEPIDANLHPEYRGANIGQAMYTALYNHSKNAMGVTHVRGGRHSSYAHRVHQKLAQNLGLGYSAEPNIGHAGYKDEQAWKDSPTRSYDAKWGPYRYTLR